jgi:hypothetical protein
MLSQYSWGDFFKFVLVLAIPYYAYVIIKYYREDIREWISNRGKAEPKQPLQEQEEEDTSQSIFIVNDYSDPEESKPVSHHLIPSGPLPMVAASAPVIVPQSSPLYTSEAVPVDIDLQGPSVDEQPEAVFSLPVSVPVDNLTEQSIDEIIAAAGRIEPNENGVLKPVESDDEPAAKLAAAINNQQGRSAFADFSFTR